VTLWVMQIVQAAREAPAAAVWAAMFSMDVGSVL
jgi:hypothetical protein